ncbi:MAG: hypothetical protein ACK4SA_14960, partial [Caldilinea sp.]
MTQLQRPSFWLTLVLLLALSLSACAPAAAPMPTPADTATQPAAPAPASTTSQSRPNVVYDLPDLGGRVISAAMANDYTPLQYIDPATGEAVGWEYDAVTEICARLN